MKAAQISSFGSLDVVEAPDPVVEPGVAIVRIRAASVNPSDVKNMQGAMKQTTLPRIPGRDFAGVVEQGPAEWVGKEVWGAGGDVGFTRDGAHAELLAVPVESLREKPSPLDLDQAATIGVSFIAAWCSVVEAADLQPGETIAIIGSSGAVGGAAGQIACAIGARVLGVDRVEPLPDTPILAVADQMIVDAVDIPTAVRDATGGEGVHVVLDTVGGPMFAQSLACLRVGGRLVAISAAGGREVTFDLADFYHNESRLFGVDTLKRDLVASAAILEKLKPGFESGQYRSAPIASRFSLDDSPKAYEWVRQGMRGRVVIVPAE